MKHRSERRLLLTGLLALGLVACTAGPPPREVGETIDVSGLPRDFHELLAQAGNDTPLLVDFHAPG